MAEEEQEEQKKITITGNSSPPLDESYGFHYLSVSVSRRFNTPSQPLEDGTPIIDHKVRLPTEVTVSCLVRKEKIKDAKAHLENMLNDELSPITAYKVTDKNGNEYGNLVLVDYGHTENAGDKFDNYCFDLKFREVMFS